MTVPYAVLGADAIVSALGWWPSFHDAEILDVHIVRGGASTVTLLMVDVRKPPDIVTFSFEEIEYLELGGESADVQNVIGEIVVESSGGFVTVTFHPCYGLSGYIKAKRVSARLEPRTEGAV